MTARKTKSEQDDKTTAGTDKSKTTQTTEQAADKADEVPTSAQKVEESNTEGAASGNVEGGVVAGDTGLEGDYELEEVSVDEVEGAVGTVSEANLDGEQFDVPYVLLTADNFPRTSDSDDPAKAWTAQEAAEKREDDDGNELDTVALVPVEGTPGQTFRLRELPNREVMEKAGIDYEQWVSGLPVRPDVPNEAPRRGTPA